MIQIKSVLCLRRWIRMTRDSRLSVFRERTDFPAGRKLDLSATSFEAKARRRCNAEFEDCAAPCKCSFGSVDLSQSTSGRRSPAADLRRRCHERQHHLRRLRVRSATRVVEAVRSTDGLYPQLPSMPRDSGPGRRTSARMLARLPRRLDAASQN